MYFLNSIYRLICIHPIVFAIIYGIFIFICFKDVQVAYCMGIDDNVENASPMVQGALDIFRQGNVSNSDFTPLQDVASGITNHPIVNEHDYEKKLSISFSKVLEDRNTN